MIDVIHEVHRFVRTNTPVNLKFLHIAPFFQNGAKSGFEMCFGLSTLGAGAKTRLESRLKKFTPHCVCSGVESCGVVYRPEPINCGREDQKQTKERGALCRTAPHGKRATDPFAFAFVLVPCGCGCGCCRPGLFHG